MTVMVSRNSLWNLINIYSKFFSRFLSLSFNLNLSVSFFTSWRRCRRRRFIGDIFFLLNACVTLRDKIIIIIKKKQVIDRNSDYEKAPTTPEEKKRRQEEKRPVISVLVLNTS